MSKPKHILSINAGSSSIKTKLFLFPSLEQVFKASVNDVGKGKPLTVQHSWKNGDGETKLDENKSDSEQVIASILETISSLLSEDLSVSDTIPYVTHRMVHGGTHSTPMIIETPSLSEGGNEEAKEQQGSALDELDRLSAFAPLHNHASVKLIKEILRLLPRSKQIICFDTIFHRSIPPHIYTYPLSSHTANAKGESLPLRKYGFHGLSYASILRSVSSYLQRPEDKLNLIVAHLGSGASVCMISNGKSADTSMGLSPLEGLPGATRSGSVDPSVVFHLFPEKEGDEKVNIGGGIEISKAEETLNKKSGFQAIAGTSNFKDISEGKEEEKELAYNLFLDRVLNFLGAYYLKLLSSTFERTDGKNRGIDGIVFSGGIGEKSERLWRDVIAHFRAFGAGEIREGEERNGVKSLTDGGSVPFFVCKTDEEAQCARMAKDLVGGKA
ncbi:acetate kinase [Atractiella rhizophila]|nr:acetate kinase [Atractiella rhizophila]